MLKTTFISHLSLGLCIKYIQRNMHTFLTLLLFLFKFTLASTLTLGQSQDCSSLSEITLKYMANKPYQYNNYNCWHTKKINKNGYIFGGIYCMVSVCWKSRRECVVTVTFLPPASAEVSGDRDAISTLNATALIQYYRNRVVGMCWWAKSGKSFGKNRHLPDSSGTVSRTL